MRLPPLLRRLLTFAFVGAALGFLALTAVRNWQDVRRFDWHVRPIPLLLSLAAMIAVLAWGVFVWSRVLARFRQPRPSYPALLRIWFFSNATRYIPGKIWQFVATARLARNAGHSGTLTLTSLILHAGFSLLAAGVIAAETLPLRRLGADLTSTVGIRVAAPALALLLVHPALINAALRLVPRALHKEVLVWHGTWADGATLLLLNLLSWVFQGVAFFLFVDALVPIPWTVLLPLAGVNALSFAVGYVAFIVPAGLGVREAAMTLLLGSFAPDGVAAVIAALSRLWIIAAEVGGAILAALLPNAQQRA
jgi:uncharacterized membrane protein YbhN (UPF0104 family)